MLSLQNAEYRCLIRATDGKKKIATEVHTMQPLHTRLQLHANAEAVMALQVGRKEQGRFQGSYATILRVCPSHPLHMGQIT